MSNTYYTIKADGTHELIIKKSRFICQLKRVETLKEAEAFISAVKKEHYKANHNCSAFILATNPITERSSDDGEPSGTAGKPMLEVLRKKNLTNVVAVTTRYFGGIKLGSGGLIRAYASSVAEGLEAIGIVKGEEYFTQKVQFPYTFQGQVTFFLENHPQYQLKEFVYLADVTAIIMVKKDALDSFQKEITELLNGQLQLETGPSTYFETSI